MTANVEVETLILSHANADFDAFAGMLAAQLLYPGARICLHGGVNRNVREFYNLHADQIPRSSPRRWTATSVRRLVLVEVTEPGAARRVRASWRGATDVEVIVFDHHGDAAARTGDRASSATTAASSPRMLRLLLERGIAITPMHATAFALGIHEDTGSLTYASTTQRDVEALAACLRAGREPGAARALPARPAPARAARAAAPARRDRASSARSPGCGW